MGFVSPVQSLLDEFGVQKDARGNARADTEGVQAYATSMKKVFAAGDMRRGQSLVVWAIREGRQCARAVDEHLMDSLNCRASRVPMAATGQRSGTLTDADLMAMGSHGIARSYPKTPSSSAKGTVPIPSTSSSRRGG